MAGDCLPPPLRLLPEKPVAPAADIVLLTVWRIESLALVCVESAEEIPGF